MITAERAALLDKIRDDADPEIRYARECAKSAALRYLTRLSQRSVRGLRDGARSLIKRRLREERDE